MSESTQSRSMHRHSRSGKSSNRRRLLLGTSTYWIPPSSYDRWQFSAKTVGTGNYRHSTPNLYYKSAPLTPQFVELGYAALTDRIPWHPGPSRSKVSLNHFDLVNARNMALTKALNDLGDAKANLGEALATSRQTATMFVDAAWDLLTFVRSIRNGRFVWELRNLSPKRIKDLVTSGVVPRAAADRWLAFHYGWKPLAQDVYGTWELLNEALSSTPALLVHGRGSSEVKATRTGTVGMSSGNPAMKFDLEAEFQIRVNITGRVQEGNLIRSVNQAGLVNPLQLAWELIPFSFVIDWITPIGGVLSALSATTGLTFVGGHRTERWCHKTTAEVISPSIIGNGDPPSYEFSAFGFERRALGSFPRPAPYVKPFYTGGDRIATIAALLTNLLQFRKG